MSRHAKDLAMAQEIARAAAKMPPKGKDGGMFVAGVVGNTKARALELIELVRKVAAEEKLDISHVEFRAIGGDALVSS